MGHNYIKYRGAYIDIYHFINDDGDWECVAGIYHNGVCCKIVSSHISETKAMDKAKKHIDESMEGIE